VSRSTGAAPTAPLSHPVAQRLGNQALQHLLRAHALQPKLTVSRPDDVYEQEAERVADEVMRMPEPTAGTPNCSAANGAARVQRRCSSCAEELAHDPGQEEPIATEPLRLGATLQREMSPDDGTLVRRKPDQDAEPQVGPQIEADINALAGRGRPLPEAIRSFMEPRFDADFSAVRVHTDARAGELARGVSAQAFAVGRDIVFGAGHYAPETAGGRRLLAHELVHVVQQGAAGPPRVQRHNAADPRLPASQAEAFAFAAAANTEIQNALTRLPTRSVPAASARIASNVPALVAQEGITLRPLTPRHDSAAGAADIQFFHGSTSYAGGVTLPAIATHHISADSKTISIRARDHADVDNRLLAFEIDDLVELAVLEAGERLATRSTTTLTVFERYRARFNAMVLNDPMFTITDQFDPTLSTHGPRSTGARAIFDEIYASDPTFRTAYDANTGGIKERVDSYMGPESLNPLASPGLQRLRAAFFPFTVPVTATATYNALRSAVQTASATLTTEDRTAVEQSNAWQRLLNDHVTTAARRQELRTIIATPPAAPAAAAPVVAAPVIPPAVGAVTPQQFVDSVFLAGPSAPVPAIERDVAVTLTPQSGVANPGAAVSSQITIAQAAQVSGSAVSPTSPWPNGATTGVAFTPQILVSTGAALDAQLALTGGPAPTNPIPPVHFTIDDQRQSNFITAWEPELQFNTGLFQDVFVPGSSSVRYISGGQQFGLVGTIPNAPFENPRLTLSIEGQVLRGGTSIAGPQTTPWPAGADRTATVLLAFTPPSPFPVSGLDNLDVQFRLRDASNSVIDTRTINVDVGPEATYTQAQAEAAWQDDFDFFHTDTPSLLDHMVASGESRRMAFADMVRNGLLTLHPMIVRHDSAAYVTQFNAGTPDPTRHAWLVNTPPYNAMPLPAAMDPTHTHVAPTSWAAMSNLSFTAVPGPFVCLNRTDDVSTGHTRDVDTQMMLAVHEAVHEFDFLPAAAMGANPIEWYRTEFRAYWTDGRFGPPDQAIVPGRPELDARFDPTIPPPGPKSPRASRIFHLLYDDPVGYGFVRTNYDNNTNHFREQVDAYLIPDGINLIETRRLELLRRIVDPGPGASFATYRANIRTFFGVGAAPAAGVLDANELAYIRSSRAWRDLIFARVLNTANRATLLGDMGIPL